MSVSLCMTITLLTLQLAMASCKNTMSQFISTFLNRFTKNTKMPLLIHSKWATINTWLEQWRLILPSSLSSKTTIMIIPVSINRKFCQIWMWLSKNAGTKVILMKESSRLSYSFSQQWRDTLRMRSHCRRHSWQQWWSGWLWRTATCKTSLEYGLLSSLLAQSRLEPPQSPFTCWPLSSSWQSTT